MSYRRQVLLLLLSLAAAGETFARKVELVEGNEAVANEVLVKFRAEEMAGLPGAISANNVELVERLRASLVRLRSRDKGVIELMRDLASRADVLYAEPNYLIYPTDVPDDPLFGNQYALQNVGQVIFGQPGVPGADIGAVSA